LLRRPKLKNMEYSCRQNQPKIEHSCQRTHHIFHILWTAIGPSAATYYSIAVIFSPYLLPPNTWHDSQLYIKRSQDKVIIDLSSKTPIFHMERHPLYDNYILVASDNHLRLLNLNSEEFCKKYTARFNSTDVHIC
jgi:hypothetical protein